MCSLLFNYSTLLYYYIDWSDDALWLLNWFSYIRIDKPVKYMCFIIKIRRRFKNNSVREVSLLFRSRVKTWLPAARICNCNLDTCCEVYFETKYQYIFQRFKTYQDMENMASILVAQENDNAKTRSLKARSYVSEITKIKIRYYSNKNESFERYMTFIPLTCCWFWMSNEISFLKFCYIFFIYTCFRLK